MNSFITKRLLRSVFAATLFAAPWASDAQDVIRQFVANGPLDGLAVKQATEVLLSLDADVVISFHEDHLKVRVAEEISPDVVLAALNSTSMHYSLPSNGRTRMPGLAEQPVFMDTGDPAGDEARYQAAKHAWMTMYPDAYLFVTDPASGPAVPPTLKAP